LFELEGQASFTKAEITRTTQATKLLIDQTRFKLEAKIDAIEVPQMTQQLVPTPKPVEVKKEVVQTNSVDWKAPSKYVIEAQRSNFANEHGYALGFLDTHDLLNEKIQKVAEGQKKDNFKLDMVIRYI